MFHKNTHLHFSVFSRLRKYLLSVSWMTGAETRLLYSYASSRAFCKRKMSTDAPFLQSQFLIVWLTTETPTYSPLDRFSPRGSISNLQYSTKHRNKASGRKFCSLAYVMRYISHQARLTDYSRLYLATRLCFLRATGQQNPCFLTEGKAFQLLVFPVRLPASTGRAETLQVLQKRSGRRKTL